MNDLYQKALDAIYKDNVWLRKTTLEYIDKFSHERVLHERREAMLLRKLRWANVRTFFALVVMITSSVALCLL